MVAQASTRQRNVCMVMINVGMVYSLLFAHGINNAKRWDELLGSAAVMPPVVRQPDSQTDRPGSDRSTACPARARLHPIMLLDASGRSWAIMGAPGRSWVLLDATGCS